MPPLRRRYEGTCIVAEPGKDTRYRVVLGVGVGALVLDQLTKLWVLASLPYYGAVTVIPGFFDLVNIRNRGAAFGFLNRSDIEWQFWLFFAATLVSAGVIFMLARSAQRGEKLLFWGLGMVLGGAVGNLVDRIRFRAVVDFGSCTGFHGLSVGTVRAGTDEHHSVNLTIIDFLGKLSIHFRCLGIDLAQSSLKYGLHFCTIPGK